ncbi:MAG: GH3 auxin-responsive promoter family protein [Candidatus Helarchaeota archaeon]|nr:GH3 auxin-responsive promoter family protein [Candidatus Helarchaeota archaeon]
MGFFELIGGGGARVFRSYSNRSLKNPLKSQQQLLGEILKRHKSTLFGKRHKFNEIRSIRQFQAYCQPHSYEYFKPYIDAYFAGKRDALFNSHLLFFAQTTGTTGPAKLFPVPNNTIRNYTIGVLRTACYYISEDIRENSKIFGGKWLYLPAPPLLRYISGIPVGYITGLLMVPFGIQYWRYILNYKYYTPLHLLHVKNPDKKFRIIINELPSKKTTMVIGSTSVVVSFLENIAKYSNVQTLDELFPNLQFAILSGVSPKFYESRLNTLLSRNFTYREMYAATEGMLAIQMSKLPHLTPLYDSVFFEFLPLKDTSERLLIDQIKKGEEYSLIITSHNGLYAYEIGDVIKVVSEDPPAIVFSFRKNILDLTGEKITPYQIFSAFKSANEQNQCNTLDFCVIGMHKPKPRYIFLIEFVSKKEPDSLPLYLGTLDRALEELSVGYQYNRFDKGTLVAPELWVLKNGTFHSLEKETILNGVQAGQIKATHLSRDTKLLELFKDYVTNKISLET